MRIRYEDDEGNLDTEVKYMNAGVHIPCRNVRTLYQYTNGAIGGTVAGTAGSYNINGVLVTNAIKLYR